MLKRELGQWLLPNVLVLPITEDSWRVPSSSSDDRFWHLKHLWNQDYRLMGTWRLTYMPAFARDMGHRYVMQLDDDSFIMSPVGFNIVELFDKQSYLLAARNIMKDVPTVTWGLPELTRFYLVANKIVPTRLFEHCKPHDLSGLYTKLSIAKGHEFPDEQTKDLNRLRLPKSGGWDMTILYGNCLMWSLDWWFKPEVNRFVQLCLASGGVVNYRWNEQAVISMMWQVFVKKEQFLMFNFTYLHSKKSDAVKKVEASIVHPPG
ncbi:hypothetical protein VOLCADRAFT_104304 [Volvox carteri f. nagariensis]|uniref:Uncharacterized protein n=1 Tax=Volvox carteri f. nagariensis TaxID=3068 RepID=D8TSP5_VOLCA|nr:uncharacterized protein VOLCADRAFT_104304 [Volvox carteri f. nagariensis]EFJ49408.1 hypothetical protein VOLCADRAFT_104304 [Volvox carteri f. nagariensis]|eukprot:XP_002949389.1 hypothetical protein VOLCADRAFT_104304 [Volvox carteri f. nagariensis]